MKEGTGEQGNHGSCRKLLYSVLRRLTLDIGCVEIADPGMS